MAQHPFRKRYLVVSALSLAVISVAALGKPKRDVEPVLDLPEATPANVTAPVDEPTPEVDAPAKKDGAGPTSCPADMVLAEGMFCSNPKEECIDWMEDPELFPYARCARFKEPSTCAGAKSYMRFCIDREEYSKQGESLPLGDTSWTEAKNICEQQGKRLCAEKEWTFACEGEESRPYPYGYVRDSSVCNFEQDGLVEKGKLRDGRLPKEAKAGCLSPFGVHNMVGNIDEWVVLDHAHYSKMNNYRKMNSGLKGGWWGPLRNRCRPTTVDHDEAFHELQTGVRCCAEAEGSGRSASAQ
jgi:hypothetical protein